LNGRLKVATKKNQNKKPMTTSTRPLHTKLKRKKKKKSQKARKKGPPKTSEKNRQQNGGKQRQFRSRKKEKRSGQRKRPGAGRHKTALTRPAISRKQNAKKKKSGIGSPKSHWGTKKTTHSGSVIQRPKKANRLGGLRPGKKTEKQ